jgi:hypothetical protein
MNILQQYQFWVGFALVFLVVVFFMVAFFTAPNMTSGQYTILKFLAALCAGCAGALLTGEALFRFEGAMAQNRYFFSGTAGFALFGLVWLIFPKYSPPALPPPPNSFSMSLPPGLTFQQGAKEFAEQDNAFANFEGFTNDELNAELNSRQIDARTANDAIGLLRLATVVPNAVRKYDVRYENSTYYLRVHD